MRVFSALALGACLVGSGHGGRTYTAAEIAKLRGKTCTNMNEVQAAIGFSDPSSDPYPKLWYDTVIEQQKDCYVVYPSASERNSYELKTLSSQEASALGVGRAIRTHFNGCGVCSTLEDLSVYLEKRDLTSPVRACAMRLLKSRTIKCLRKMGFTDLCSSIWYYNTANTKKLSGSGGCFGVCIANVFADNNQPVGQYNPCKPTKEIREREMRDMAEEGTDASMVQLEQPTADQSSLGQCLPCCALSWKAGCCLPRGPHDDGRCDNTINGKPACAAEQWQPGKYRLNACLQCDECRSGPIFQKVAGRTRRGSSIASAISRPLDPSVEIIHIYD